MKAETVVGAQTQADGALAPARSLKDGSLAVSEILPRYYELSYRGNVFFATAIVTTPVIFSTAAGTGGPLLWNNSNGYNAVILAMSVGITTASGVATAIGLTFATGQTSAPGSTTAIDSGPSSLKVGAAGSRMNLYRIGTPTNAGTGFYSLGDLGTGATTTDRATPNIFDVGGAVIVPPTAWVSPSVAATATSAVCQISLVWAEVPV